jgi:beta-aspartyl-peptidase (threonine type)
MGCRVNRSDGDGFSALLEPDFAPAAPGQPADFVVINTCTVTGDGDAAARQAIRRAARENPGARIVVTGCYAQVDPGAVAGLRHIRNPIDLARLVMDKSPHVMLVGEGAEEFALEQGMDLVPGSYFYTERRWKQLEEAQKAERTASLPREDIGFFSTVGAVARDKDGNLAAATSTGGTTNKRWGRVGDSPIIGAGTYADNDSCAVSATGSGEYFIRAVVAHEICARVRLSGVSAAEAARDVVHGKLKEIGGDGGVIVVDKDGRISLEFNTEGMFRGARDSAGRREVAIY